MAIGDANVGFTLTPQGRMRLIRLLDTFAEQLPQASAFLTDLAGRIVEIARKPVGVKLEEISALAAGCYASTHQLAGAFQEKNFALAFQHEDDRQVLVWPVGERALLVVLLRGVSALEDLEEKMEGPLGADLAAVVQEAREPLQSVPPPRIEPAEVPPEVRALERALTELIMDLQAKHPTGFTPEVSSRLLHAREDLARAIAGGDWPRAGELCASTRAWLGQVFPG
ncbi:MAG: hypothetical protein AAB152_05040 [Candidatus Coatesbacteria bacterium]